MTKSWLTPFSTQRMNYALYGALFGLFFPLVATTIWCLDYNCSFIEAQTSKGHPLEWIIDTAPLFLGLFASFAGLKQDKIESELSSERKKLSHSAKLAALGELNSSITHELKNPLTAITGFADVIKMQLKKGQSLEEVLNNLDKISYSALRMSKIINGVQDFSRYGQHDQKTSYSVRKLIDETIDLAGAGLKNHSIDFSVDLAQDFQLHCRHIEISQILLNLVMNSIQAIADLDERWIKLKVYKENDNIIFDLIDSGKGIESSIEENLFKPFYTTKESGQGTGLGMSVSKQIAENHNGTLIYRLNDGHTSFRLELPMVSTLS